MKRILLFIWQLPQNLLGLLVGLFLKKKTVVHSVSWQNQYGMDTFEVPDDISVFVSPSFPGGVSLGKYVYLRNEGFKDVKHECGHCKQSLYLGWLYLLVIGLPSALGNLYDRIAHKSWPYFRSCKWYYNQPWELWADKIYGVNRDK